MVIPSRLPFRGTSGFDDGTGRIGLSVEEQVDRGDPTVSGRYEISAGIGRRLIGFGGDRRSRSSPSSRPHMPAGSRFRFSGARAARLAGHAWNGPSRIYDETWPSAGRAEIHRQPRGRLSPRCAGALKAIDVFGSVCDRRTEATKPYTIVSLSSFAVACSEKPVLRKAKSGVIDHSDLALTRDHNKIDK